MNTGPYPEPAITQVGNLFLAKMMILLPHWTSVMAAQTLRS
jgi:hypothetical protein